MSNDLIPRRVDIRRHSEAETAIRAAIDNLAFTKHVTMQYDDAWKRSGHAVMLMERERSRWKPDRPAACGVLSGVLSA